jgi:hypothetical protein
VSALNRTVVAPLSSAIVALLLAGIVVVGVDGVDRKLREGEARLHTEGVVEVAVKGNSYVRASRDRILGRDDRVRVVEGKAVLELPSASTVELRNGSEITLAGGKEPQLVLDGGDLLVQAPHDTVKIDGGVATVSVAGSAKLRRGGSLVAGVYEGNVDLSKNDEQHIGIPQYRQAAAVGTGLLPAAPDPLDLRASDEWDRRMLGQVLSLSEQLEVFARGFESQLPSGGTRGPELFKSVIPVLADAPITPALLAGRAPGESLVGLTLVALDKGDFDDRVKRIFGFRQAGASWGLVAADRDINPNPLLNNLESAIGRLAPVLSPGGALSGSLGGLRGGKPGLNEGALGLLGPNGLPAGTVSPATPPGGGSPGTPGQPGPSNPNPPSNPPSGTPPPKKKTIDLPPTGTILDPLLNPLIDPLENLLSGVLDTLLGTSTATASSPTSTSPSSGSTATSVSSPTVTATIPTLSTTTTTTTTTAPTGGLLGGLSGTVGGLTNTVGGLLH